MFYVKTVPLKKSTITGDTNNIHFKIVSNDTVMISCNSSQISKIEASSFSHLINILTKKYGVKDLNYKLINPFQLNTKTQIIKTFSAFIVIPNDTEIHDSSTLFYIILDSKIYCLNELGNTIDTFSL